MLNKITYIFGAGASKNALPTVNEIPKRVKSLIELLEKDDYKLDDNSTYENLKIKTVKTKRDFQLEMIDSLRWMLNSCESHASVDTFAKKLFIKRQYVELKKLKIAISVFFIFEQALNKPDFRYDIFYSSILNSLTNFPENVRILSWNYDYQFEISFSEYSEQSEILANQNLLRVNSKFGDNDHYSGFGIYKLNGTTGLYRDRWEQYLYASSVKGPFDVGFVNQVTKNYVAGTYLNDIHSSLSFAWEMEDQNESIVTRAINNTNDTISLVIIGYSFPFFNREIDKKIIGSMNSLKRVYFQSPEADSIKERFQAFRNDLTDIELISKFDTGQFLLPNEL